MERKWISHAERRERRRQIADHVRKHRDIGLSAREFEVSESTVRKVCIEFGIDTPKQGNRGREMSGSTYEILADLINTDKSMKQIAKERELSVQRVSEIASKARQAGILS